MAMLLIPVGSPHVSGGRVGVGAATQRVRHWSNIARPVPPRGACKVPRVLHAQRRGVRRSVSQTKQNKPTHTKPNQTKSNQNKPKRNETKERWNTRPNVAFCWRCSSLPFRAFVRDTINVRRYTEEGRYTKIDACPVPSSRGQCKMLDPMSNDPRARAHNCSQLVPVGSPRVR